MPTTAIVSRSTLSSGRVLVLLLGSGLLACQSPAGAGQPNGHSLRNGQYDSSGGSTSSGWDSGSSYGGVNSTSGYGSTGNSGWYTTGSYGSTGNGGSYTTGGYGSTGNGGSYTTGGYGSTGNGGSYTTGGYGSTGNGGSSTTGGYGSMSVGSDGGESYTTTFGTSATTSATGSGTDEDQWYGVPGGTFLTGFVAEAYDNDDCSGPSEEGDELLSECDGNLDLEYPSHDECTTSPETSTQSCDAWCYENGNGGGVCTVEADGADHCDCELRSDFGVDPMVAGCVAEYAASDKACDQAPINYVVATCAPPEAPGLVSLVMQDKRLKHASCSQDPILEEDVDCHAYCQGINADPPGGFVIGYCETEATGECGVAAAAKCSCGLLEFAATRGAAGLGCRQVFHEPDRCDDDLPTSVSQPSYCGNGEFKNTVHTFDAAACMDTEIPEVEVDCENLTCTGGKKGQCVEGVAFACSNGENVDAAQCKCV